MLDEKVVLLPALLRLAHLRSTEDRCGLLTVCLVQARAKGLTGSIGCLAGGIEQLEDATRGVLAQVDDLLVVLVCDWRPCDALCADDRRSKAIRGDQRRSGAIRGNQARSEAIRGDQKNHSHLLLVRLAFILKDGREEKLLKLLVRKVDAQLLERVHFEELEAVPVGKRAGAVMSTCMQRTSSLRRTRSRTRRAAQCSAWHA